MVRLSLVGLLALTVGLGAVQTAAAADIPVRMPTKAPAMVVAHSWTGCYLGANAGYLWARTSFADPAGDLGSEIVDGVVAGGQIGCDYQTGPWVLGVEGMFDWTNADGGHTVTVCCPTTFTTKVIWVATATARLGYAVNYNLFYVKGGGAWDSLSHTQTALGVLVDTGNYTRSGWIIGAGWEYAFARHWSAKIEYNYLDLGSNSPVGCVVFGAPPGCGIGATVDQTAHLLLVGLNYRFWR